MKTRTPKHNNLNFLFLTILFAVLIATIMAVDVKNLKHYFKASAMQELNISTSETNVNYELAVNDLVKYENLLFEIKKFFFVNSLDIAMLILIIAFNISKNLIKFKKEPPIKAVIFGLEATLFGNFLPVLSTLCLFFGVLGGIFIYGGTALTQYHNLIASLNLIGRSAIYYVIYITAQLLRQKKAKF